MIKKTVNLFIHCIMPVVEFTCIPIAQRYYKITSLRRRNIMKRICFVFFISALTVISCGSTSPVIKVNASIKEGDTRIVKIDSDNQESSQSTEPVVTNNPSKEQPVTTQPNIDNSNIPPEAKALLDEMKKTSHEEKSAWEKKLQELQVDYDKRISSPENQKEADACTAEGNKLLAKGKYEDAAKQYIKALNFYPIHREALKRLAECNAAMDNTENNEEEIPKQPRPGSPLLLSQKFA
ncbi:MAG: hypothetical protein ABIH42_02020, partial [Planctomycetota bacterium]